MIKQDIVDNVAKATGLTKVEVEAVLNESFSQIIKALSNNEKIELRGFGTFFISEINEKYSARNPKTGGLIYVPKKNKVRFRASKKFKEFINQ